MSTVSSTDVSESHGNIERPVRPSTPFPFRRRYTITASSTPNAPFQGLRASEHHGIPSESRKIVKYSPIYRSEAKTTEPIIPEYQRPSDLGGKPTPKYYWYSCTSSVRHTKHEKTSSDPSSNSGFNRPRYPPSSWRDHAALDLSDLQRKSKLENLESAILRHRSGQMDIQNLKSNTALSRSNSNDSKILPSQLMGSMQRTPPEHSSPEYQNQVSQTRSLSLSSTSSQPEHSTLRPTGAGSLTLQNTHIDSSNLSKNEPLSSIPSAPTPFSSPQPSPSPYWFKSPRFSDSSVVYPAAEYPTARNATQSTDLPSPETAYGQVMYYTECPHTSPPCPRPLDIQPVNVPFHEGLLKFPQTFKAARTGTMSSQDQIQSKLEEVAILHGSCPACDLSSRRQKEYEIVSKYDIHFQTLMKTPRNLSNTAPQCPYQEKCRVKREINGNENSTVCHGVLETQMMKLLDQRDHEVQSVWNGLTRRWGPALIGIHRKGDASSSTASSVSTASGSRDQMEVRSYSSRRSDSRTRTRSSSLSTNHHSSTIFASSQASSRSSGRSINIRGDNNVDGIIDEGRMRIEWIRPDKISQKKE